MRLNWSRKPTPVNARSPNAWNDDLLSSDASLKAAQAIFKKHSFIPESADSKSREAPAVKVEHKASPTVRRRAPKATRRPSQLHPKDNNNTSTPSTSTNQSSQGSISAAACAAAARAQKTVWTIEPQPKAKKKRASYISPQQLKPPTSVLPTRSNSTSGSLRSHSSTKSDEFASIVAQLQGNHDVALSQGNGRVGSVSPRANASSDSVISSRLTLEDGTRLPVNNTIEPPILSNRNSSFGPCPDFNMSELENSSSSKPNDIRGLSTTGDTSGRIFVDRKSPPRVYLNTDVENASTSSIQSSAFSGRQNSVADPLSEPEYLEYSVSPNTNPYRNEHARSSIDQSSETLDHISDRLSYEALSKLPLQLKYQGTLPDLIPNHKRDKKKGRLSTIFGRKAKNEEPDASSQNGLVQQNDVAVVKAPQQTRLKTTMRASSLNQDESLSEGSSDEYESDSGDDLPSNDKKKKPRRRRVHIRKQIKKASGHHSSHNKDFNEDKPWKSHIDIGFVTQAERKRYEGMWVTNRNCYLELLPWWQDSGEQVVFVPEDGLILNLVVLDIWTRSHLPQDKLACSHI